MLAKILLQKLWLEKIGWDETLPADLDGKWKRLRQQFQTLNKLNIPRPVLLKCYKRIHIHGFSDASAEAYGACIYLKSFDSSGQVDVSLLCSKVKVAPLKQQTIPRLELCGSVLLARLFHKVVSSMHVNFNEIFLWCDSTVVLGWLKMQSKQLQPFVANRVSVVQELTNINDWRHVKSEDNAADTLSRGLFSDKILTDIKWWQGPDFLWSKEDDWPMSTTEYIGDIPDKKKEKISCNLRTVLNDFPFHKFNTVTKAK